MVAESVLVKQQLLILNRSRQRSPNLCFSDRLVAGLCALFIRPARLIRSAIVLKPSTLLSIHQALRNRKYRLLFSCKRKGNPGPKGPSKELIDAVVQMKQRNPTWGCPRIAPQMALAFDSHSGTRHSARSGGFGRDRRLSGQIHILDRRTVGQQVITPSVWLMGRVLAWLGRISPSG